MPFDHEKLDVYQAALKFSVWCFGLSRDLKAIFRHSRDQLLRASQSIPLNIAEGNGKRSRADRSRFFEIARGSALECAAILDILSSCQAIEKSDAEKGKAILHRIVSMLTRMTSWPPEVKEDLETYESRIDYDYEHEHRPAERD